MNLYPVECVKNIWKIYYK